MYKEKKDNSSTCHNLLLRPQEQRVFELFILTKVCADTAMRRPDLLFPLWTELTKY